ncbi:MAG TPA: hypothetical protein VNJ07_12040 [Chitinophagales bacterium]|nr:hypothetical protein [Chitinophagales bacterium]
MPNRDFDKTLKEKLSAYEAPFNPADWQKMEALLPQDSGKFFIVIAATFMLLFLGIGTLMLTTFLHSDNFGQAPALAEKNHPNQLEPDYGGERYVPQKLNPDNMKLSPKQILAGSKEDSATNSIGKPENNHSMQQKLITASAIETEIESKKTPEKRFSNTKKERELRESYSFIGETQSGNSGESDFQNRHLSQSVLAKGREALLDEEFAETVAKLNAGLIHTPASDEIQMPSHEETAFVVKKKRKVFEFALGAEAGTSISFISANHSLKPGYSVGLSQELMFIDRIGLALSESYSQRKYDGGQYPCNQPAGFQCPVSYTSDVYSIDFGIDVKASLIHKARWNWFVKAGVANVLKLKETFEYAYLDIDTIPPPPGLPTQTNYSNSPGTSENFDSALGGNTASEPLPDLSLSGAKRFHPAWHVSTGFEVMLNSRLKLQVETGYSFTKPTVGADDKRLHSVGMNGGIFCVFGK